MNLFRLIQRRRITAALELQAMVGHRLGNDGGEYVLYLPAMDTSWKATHQKGRP